MFSGASIKYAGARIRKRIRDSLQKLLKAGTRSDQQHFTYKHIRKILFESNQKGMSTLFFLQFPIVRIKHLNDVHFFHNYLITCGND